MKERLPSEEAHREARAVQGLAEEKARKERIEKPSTADYEEMSRALDVLSQEDPAAKEAVVDMIIHGKEIKDELGPVAYSEFMAISEEILQKRLGSLKEIKRKAGNKEEVKRMLDDWVQDSTKQLMSNERVAAILSGHEGLAGKIENLFNKKIIDWSNALIDRFWK